MYKLREPLQEKEYHLRCINYSGNYSKAAIRLLTMEESYHFERETAEPEVVLLNEGVLNITLDGTAHYRLSSGKMFFLPSGIGMSLSVIENVTMVVIGLDLSQEHCARVGFNKLAELKEEIGGPFNPLDIRSSIRIFLSGLMPFLEDGMLCSNYLKAKTTEFIHIFRNYYSKRELAAFFYPLLGEDMVFNNFISQNIRRIKSIEEFAHLANMSRTGFVDKFRRKMGQSPAIYIKKARLELIKADLIDPQIPLKEVAYRNGYDHYEVFSKFCKKNLGLSPREFRERAR